MYLSTFHRTKTFFCFTELYMYLSTTEPYLFLFTELYLSKFHRTKPFFCLLSCTFPRSKSHTFFYLLSCTFQSSTEPKPFLFTEAYLSTFHKTKTFICSAYSTEPYLVCSADLFLSMFQRAIFFSSVPSCTFLPSTELHLPLAAQLRCNFHVLYIEPYFCLLYGVVPSIDFTRKYFSLFH